MHDGAQKQLTQCDTVTLGHVARLGGFPSDLTYSYAVSGNTVSGALFTIAEASLSVTGVNCHIQQLHMRAFSSPFTKKSYIQ